VTLQQTYRLVSTVVVVTSATRCVHLSLCLSSVVSMAASRVTLCVIFSCHNGYSVLIISPGDVLQGEMLHPSHNSPFVTKQLPTVIQVNRKPVSKR